jgi:hypothetical protein
LQTKAVLNSEEAEIHLQNLPQRKLRFASGHVMSNQCCQASLLER